MCLLEAFGKTYTKSPKESERTLCNKYEAILRGVEQAMEFRREDFIRLYFPLLLTHVIHKATTDGRARLMIVAMAQFSLVTAKELLQMHLHFYFPAITMNLCPSMSDLNAIIKFLQSAGISFIVLKSLVAPVNSLI